MKYPIAIQSHFNNIYWSYYDDSDKRKHYDIVKTFKDYFYTSDIQSPIINKAYATKRFVENSIYKNKEASTYGFTFEADLPLYKRFYIDTYQEFLSIPKSSIRVGIIDIETWAEGKINIEAVTPILSISTYDSETKEIYTFAWHDDRQYKDPIKKIAVFKTEIEMIEAWLKFMGMMKFDLLTGWNFTISDMGPGFDLPYICNRLKKFEVLGKLSPFGKVENVTWGYKNYWEVYGINTLDYLEVYSKFATSTVPSFSLNNVSAYELGEEKLSYEAEGNLNNLWKTNIEKFLDYNRKDVELVVKIDEKLKYIDLIDELRRIGCVNFRDAIDNANIHDSLIVRLLNKKGFIVKSKNYANKTDRYPGGYTYLKFPGIYKFVGDLDFTSLYPFIIRRLNISPESKVDSGELKAASGIRFSKKVKGVIPSILDWEYQQRDFYKSEMKKAMKEGKIEEAQLNDIKQYAFKILMNSFYGWLGYTGSRFFDIDLASSVTMTGQMLIKYAIVETEKLGYTVITSDTDSILFTHSKFTTVDEVAKDGDILQKTLNGLIDCFIETNFNVKDTDFDYDKKFTNPKDYKINLKNEYVASKGIFFFKRRYCMWLKKREGHDVDVPIFKGLKIVQSNTPNFAKEHLRELYNTVLQNDDYVDRFPMVYKSFVDHLMIIDQNELGVPFNLSKKMAMYVKTLPAHVRGAMRWDAMFKDRISFDDVIKGKYFYIKKYPEQYTAVFQEDILKKKEIVLSVPEGYKLPDGFEVNRERHMKLTIENSTENLRNIINDKAIHLVHTYVKGLIAKKGTFTEEQKKTLKLTIGEYKEDGDNDLNIQIVNRTQTLIDTYNDNLYDLNEGE